MFPVWLDTEYLTTVTNLRPCSMQRHTVVSTVTFAIYNFFPSPSCPKTTFPALGLRSAGPLCCASFSHSRSGRGGAGHCSSLLQETPQGLWSIENGTPGCSCQRWFPVFASLCWAADVTSSHKMATQSACVVPRLTSQPGCTTAGSLHVTIISPIVAVITLLWQVLVLSAEAFSFSALSTQNSQSYNAVRHAGLFRHILTTELFDTTFLHYYSTACVIEFRFSVAVT